MATNPLTGKVLSDWIAAHLWQIAFVIAAAYSGLVTGTNSTARDIAEMKQAMARLEAKTDKLDDKIEARGAGLSCARRDIARLLDRHKQEPTCQMTVPE